MSILSINSTYKTKTVDNPAVELRLKKDGRFLVNEKHVQFTPISVLVNRLNLETEYDKVVLVLRHSIRPLNDWSTNVELTDLGKYSASLAGKHLNGISTKFKYIRVCFCPLYPTKKEPLSRFFYMVGVKRLELPCRRRLILSQVRLPISPHAHILIYQPF